MRVGYLGPAGTFSHEALLGAGGDVEPVPQPTLHDAVLAVHDGAVERALVPFENSLEGAVNPVLDALVFEARDVRIVGELVHAVRHCLVARPGVTLEEVSAVVSHPQAAAQCARFLRTALAGVPVVPAASTADAVRQAAEAREPLAALGSRAAADAYGAAVLRDDVADDPENATRFVWLARQGTPTASSAGAKTALAFWGEGSSAPGWLVGCLQEFASRDVNLTRIESRPLRRGLGRYLFVLELEGGESDPGVAAALEGLRAKVEAVRVLGSFYAA
jgi:prephenate dehydratase